MVDTLRELNILTHKRAREKFCPLTMVLGGGVQACKGSECLAWRLLESSHQQTRSYGDPSVKSEPHRPHDVPADWEWDSSKAHWFSPARGYCGIVGEL